MDAEASYYLLALGIAGAVSGMLIQRAVWAHYLGALLGQVAYELVFLEVGPLFILGLVFLAVYSIVFLLAARIAASLRKARNNEATAV